MRRELAPPVGQWQRLPLIPGTEAFSNHWLPDYHARDCAWIRHSVACYSLLGARVSGTGQIWVNDRLVTSPEIMPPYIAEGLDIAAGGSARLHAEASLPVRSVETPCLVAVGHGSRVYGHFLVEMLFRILTARAAFSATGLRFQYLLSTESPPWLLEILERYLAIGRDQMVFFNPAQEQVALRHAIVPTLLLRPGGFHPFANTLIERCLRDLDLPDASAGPARVFAVRQRFYNPAAPNRICLNEDRLAAIAAQRHGFVPISMETLSWPDQIALFRGAETMLGLAGSALHTAIFAKPGSRLASLGAMNSVQSDIGALRRQYNAILGDDVPVDGEFLIDEDRFTTFLDAVCSWPGARPPPGQP
ncbi:MAG TPA: glycosyltransferase 61 family protein [Acidisoma sp.]|uniref:glycosyltransferase family 61 protein n=1 Tax=Acidisoma sp. TaxID=1872115 RepID=UPI002C3D5F4A|nr:glycosyltransferase 61 family protein [Acidisoma sp.]HTI03118.1 glycosyltransferase 61 family protein [Acidisoma sp.]